MSESKGKEQTIEVQDNAASCSLYGTICGGEAASSNEKHHSDSVSFLGTIRSAMTPTPQTQPQPQTIPETSGSNISDEISQFAELPPGLPSIIEGRSHNHVGRASGYDYEPAGSQRVQSQMLNDDFLSTDGSESLQTSKVSNTSK